MRPILALLVLAACKKDKGPAPPPAGDDDDNDSAPPECVEDADCGRSNVCEEGACVVGDRDNTFEEATPLPLGEELAVDGVINPAGDVDTYVYDSPGEEWVSIRTVPADAESDVDTVVTLYDAAGEVQASMDNYPVYPFLVTGYDSVLYAYLPDAGSWYITVEDRSSFFDDLVPQGGRSFDYRVLVREANGSGEPDSATDPSLSVDVADGSTIIVFGMVIDEPGDSDFATITFPFSDRLLEVWGEPLVTGSSAHPLIRLRDVDDAIVAEKTGFGAAELTSDGITGVEWLSWFRASAGTFVLEGTDAGDAGANDAWFPLFVRTYDVGDPHPFFGDSVYEREVEPNDDPATALPLTRTEETSSDGPYGAFRLDGEFTVARDSDWYSVAADKDATTTVRCWTDRFGSLAILDVELYSQDVKFGEGATGDDLDYYVVDAIVPAAGDVDVRIVSNADDGTPAYWYRCAVYVTP